MMPRPTALDAARRFRAQLEAQELAAFNRMSTIYQGIFRAILPEIAALSEEIARVEFPDKESVLKLARLGRLLDQIEIQVTRFGGTVLDEITLAQRMAIEQSVTNAMELIELSLPPDLPPELWDAVRGSFVRLPADAIESAAGLLAEDSPLADLLRANYGPAVKDQVAQHILDGIGAGMNPQRIAILLEQNFANSLGQGLTWAMTTVRTAQIKSYRLANHAIFEANSDLVPTWTWVADIGSDRTCMSCINKHGSVHPVTESLDDHHSGRCVPVPNAITFEDLGLDIPERRTEIETGEEWFKRQPKAVQIERMGPAKYRAWKAGAFEFSQLSQEYDDDVYGVLLREASLKHMVGLKEAKEFY
jgi:hypothetical protein